VGTEEKRPQLFRSTEPRREARLVFGPKAWGEL
jgi:hypothetical protein